MNDVDVIVIGAGSSGLAAAKTLRAAGLSIKVLEAMGRMIPLGRGGTPEEAADAIYLFCSPESNYISGQVIVAGGGLLI